MAVGPLLPWRAASGELLRKRLLIPAWAGGITLVVALLLGARGIAKVLTFALAAFAFASIGRTIGIGVRARRRVPMTKRCPSRPCGWCAATRGCTAACVVHVGVVVIAVALAASSGYVDHGARCSSRRVSRRRCAATRSRTSVRRSNDRVRRRRSRRASASNRGARTSVCTHPAISTFPNFTSGIGTPSVRTGVLHDVYLTLVSSPTQTGKVTLRRADQHDGDVAVDRRRHHGARRRPRACCRLAGGRCSPRPSRFRTSPSCRTRPNWWRPRHEAAASVGSRSAFGAIVVVFGVVLALNVNGERSQRHQGPVHGFERSRAGVHPETLDGKSSRSPTSRARPSS